MSIADWKRREEERHNRNMAAKKERLEREAAEAAARQRQIDIDYFSNRYGGRFWWCYHHEFGRDMKATLRAFKLEEHCAREEQTETRVARHKSGTGKKSR